VPITTEQASRLLSGAQDHARRLGIRVTVAVVDEGGFLVLLGRMDGAPPLSAQIAEAKAVGAAVWHRDGGALAQVQQERPAFFDAVSSMTRTPLIGGLGSVLLRGESGVLGGAGVSGGKPEQDLECAEAGLRAAGLAGP
jgi:uncharacterized protein GlcG (DUF336 family)